MFSFCFAVVIERDDFGEGIPNLGSLCTCQLSAPLQPMQCACQLLLVLCGFCFAVMIEEEGWTENSQGLAFPLRTSACQLSI